MTLDELSSVVANMLHGIVSDDQAYVIVLFNRQGKMTLLTDLSKDCQELLRTVLQDASEEIAHNEINSVVYDKAKH